MPGIGDFLATLLGGPSAQIAAALGQGPGQPGGRPSPLPGAPAGPGAPPGGGPPPGPPAGGGPPAGPPQPQAYTSPPDMAAAYAQLASGGQQPPPGGGGDVNSQLAAGQLTPQVYLQMVRQQQANEMFNRGIAGVAASFARPWNREAIRQSMMGLTPDPGEVMGNIMKLQQFGYLQQQQQAFQQAIPDLAKKLNLTPQEVAALGPDAARTAAQYGAPPEVARNYAWFKNQYVGEHANDPGPDGQPIGAAAAGQKFEADNPPGMIMLGAIGGNLDPNLTQMRIEGQQWQKENPGKPVPDQYKDPATFVAWKQSVQQKKEAQTQALDNYPKYNAALTDLRSKVAALTSPDNAADLQTIMTLQPSTIAAIRTGGFGSEIAQKFGVTPSQIDLIHSMDDLAGYDMRGLMAANPRQAQDLSLIGQNLAPITRIGAGAAGLAKYQANAQTLLNNIDTARANARGATGQLDQLVGDKDLEDKVDPSYLPGGSNFLGKAKPMGAADIAKAQAAIGNGADLAKIIRRYKLSGYDTTPLEAQLRQ